MIGFNEGLRKHAMHGAAMIGLLGTLAGLGFGGMKISKVLQGDPTVNQRSLTFVILMTILCGAFVVFCLQSFRNARKIGQSAQAE